MSLRLSAQTYLWLLLQVSRSWGGLLKVGDSYCKGAGMGCKVCAMVQGCSLSTDRDGSDFEGRAATSNQQLCGLELSCLAVFAEILQPNYFVPCWRSTQLSCLPICTPRSVLHFSAFLLHAPCCCWGLGHRNSFHLLSFLVRNQSWWRLASALQVCGLLGAVCSVLLRAAGMLRTLWINHLPDCKG